MDNLPLLQAIFAETSDAIFVKDLDGRYLLANRAAADFLGRPEAEIIGQDELAFFPPEQARHLMETDCRIMMTGTTEVAEEITVVGGEQRTFLSTRRVYRDAGGNIAGLIGTWRDITERKRAEALARRAAARNAALAELSHVLADLSLEVPALQEMIAHRLVALLGDACGIRLLSEDGQVVLPGVIYHPSPDVQAGLRMLANTGPQRIGEGLSGRAASSGQAILVPNLSLESLRDVIGPVYWPAIERMGVHTVVVAPLRVSGKVIGVVMFFRIQSPEPYTEEDLVLAQDLAGRAALAIHNALLFQQAQQALRRKDEALVLLDTLQARAPIGIAFLDHELRVVRINDAFTAMNDLPIKRYLGRTLSEVLPDLAPALEPLIRKVLQSGQPIVDFELSGETPADPGRKRYWLYSFYAVPLSNEQMPGVGMIVAETTEHKRLEAQLIQAQKMESVGRLAGGIAHDFNNLLTAILGYAGLARESLTEDSPIASDLDEIKKASERAASLTRQLLAFARKQVIEPEVLDLNSLVQNLEKLLHRLIGEDIDLVIHTAPGLRAVKADAGQIEQIIMNLAINARDAMPSGGMLTIETANVQLDGAYVRQHLGAVAGEYVLVAVSDTGTGMSEETKQHIFEPFFTTKPQGKGTGLGLATCYGIVKQHGGYIMAYSELGLGTTFKMYLPSIDEQAEARPRETPAPASLIGHETILLAEDEVAVRDLAARVLREHGYTVLEASDGEEAYQRIAEAHQQIDLLLTDVIMPKMHGSQLAERIIAMHPHIRVLFISGYTDNTLVHRQELVSGGTFLQKPFSAGALARKVREVLDA